MKLVFYEPIRAREQKSDYITRILRDNIIYMNLVPGQAISEHAICKVFESSRTPVREAFIKLINEGLLVVQPQKGTYISLINKKWVKNFLFMRATIETEIMRQVCSIDLGATIAKMESNLRLQEEPTYHNPKDFIQLDKEFHSYIYQSVDKYDVWQVIDNNQFAYDRLRVIIFHVDQSYQITIDHHKKILEAVKTQDLALLLLMVESHIGSQFSLFANHIEKHSHYFMNEY